MVKKQKRLPQLLALIQLSADYHFAAANILLGEKDCDAKSDYSSRRGRTFARGMRKGCAKISGETCAVRLSVCLYDVGLDTQH
jgi:hypothetical protein